MKCRLVLRIFILVLVMGCYPIKAQESLAPTTESEKSETFAEKVNNELTNLIGSSTIPIPKGPQPIKSDLDSREYRYLILPNQLKVLLISDPESQSSAAAVNVAVGSNQNPPERLGLAHFLEHMLFLGTEKYPLPGEYQQYIAQQGGMHNASTAAENTWFYFNVRHQAFEPALDRFSQFFIAPLFNEIYIERERQAVQAEFSAKLTDDFRREWDVLRELMNSQHPGSQFAVGNSQTLADREGDLVRDDLIDFYQSHYSAEKMTLVVLSNQPLSQLETWVSEKFTAVPKREMTASVAKYPPLFNADFLPATLEVVPEKDLHQLVFNFPIPQSKTLLINKPYDYLAHLLGHESQGSFLAILKNLGWAEALNAGIALPSRDDALFQIRIQLTSQGVKAKDQIASLLFYVIKEIEKQGVESWRYDELRVMSENQFRYDEKLSPMDTVAYLAQNMQDFPVQEILRGRGRYAGFDEKQIAQCLSYLRADNMLVTLSSPQVTPLRITNLYSVPFLVKRDVAPILDIKNNIKQDFILPKHNPLLPAKLTVKSSSILHHSKPVDEAPSLIIEKDRTRIWYKQDQEFNQPKSAIHLHLLVPPDNMNPERSSLHYLFAESIKNQLNDTLYFAQLAGLELQLTAHARGIDISVFGFSNRQSLFLNYVIAALGKPTTSKGDFNRLKSELIRRWRNEEKALPYQVMINQLPSLFVRPQWSSSELASALELVDFDQFTQFSQQYLWDTKIEGLIHGNYLPQEAIKLSAIIEHGLQARQTGRKVSDSVMTIMADNQVKPWLYYHPLKHTDKLVALYIQAPSSTDSDAARMLLLRQILQPEFFHQLRTEKQMGYVVAAIPYPIKQIEGTLFLVQSPNYSELIIQQAVNQFLGDKTELVAKEFVIQKDSLIQKLQEAPRSFREQDERFWQALLHEDYSFDRRQRLIEVLKHLTPEELLQYYSQVFQNQNRRLWMATANINAHQNFQSFP